MNPPHACELSRFFERLTGVAGCSDEPTVVRSIANDQPIDLIFDPFAVLANDGDQRHLVSDTLLDKKQEAAPHPKAVTLERSWVQLA